MAKKEKMESIERLRYCDKCAVKNGKGNIVGGEFCVKLAAFPNLREKFRERIPARPVGSTRFWSCQVQQDIEDCEIFQQSEAEQRALVAAGVLV